MIQELKKFFDDESKRDEAPKAKQGKVSDNLMDKMGETMRQIELEKAEHERQVEKHIAKLKKKQREKSSRSRSRGKRSKRSRSGSHKRGERSTASRGRSRSKDKRGTKSRGRSASSEEGHNREEGDGKEDFTVSMPFEPPPDPNTKEGRCSSPTFTPAPPEPIS